MVDVIIVHADDELPKATGAYMQVIARKDQDDPGRFISEIEHFTLSNDGVETRIGREVKDIGFREAVAFARDYAAQHGIGKVYATDRTAADIE